MTASCSNWFSWEFKFYLDDRLIAAVFKRFVHLTDTYGVAIYPGNPLVHDPFHFARL